MKTEVKQKFFVPTMDRNKPVTLTNNNGLILIRKSKYLEDLTKQEKKNGTMGS